MFRSDSTVGANVSFQGDAKYQNQYEQKWKMSPSELSGCNKMVHRHKTSDL